MTKPWNMARTASRRELPKQRKMHGPVGPAALLRQADGMNWTHAVREAGVDLNKLRLGTTHKCCGMHVCSCAPKREPARRVGSTDLCGKHLVSTEQCGCRLTPFFVEQPAVGTWEWAKSQMKRGKIVKRALWETTILRNTHGYPEMSSNAGKNWRGAAHIEDVFEKRTDWQLVDVDPR